VKLLTYLQQTHHFPRRTITQWIKEGKILVNETKIEGFAHILNNGDIIEIVGLWKKEAKISTTATTTTQLIAFNKPAGYVVSKADTHNPTIFEILPLEYEHYYPIGRLDKESTGLLLLTNDSKLVHELSHPSKELTKIYHIRLHKLISEFDKTTMLQGIKVDGDGDLE
jgi:23S rRNA pseudouridine2605 synthase